MRQLGAGLIAFGIVWLLIAFNMDTSVEVGGMFGGRVENIGLIAQRQNHLMIAGLMTLIGTLLVILGGARPAMSRESSDRTKSVAQALPPMARDLSADNYRLWLAGKYEIKRNELFDKFVFAETTFDDLDAALAAAHEVDAAEHAKIEALAAERLARQEEQRIAYEQASEEHKKADRIAYIVIGCFIAIIATIIIASL